ncbi:ABC transporter permease subunit [Sphaerisporangium sp. NBC_01403]|uniref:ABC transporter permease n=1 Tax=Sphaerisporangium sp. NBC_01403 TaxID=2903599 RepID=UPI0032433593
MNPLVATGRAAVAAGARTGGRRWAGPVLGMAGLLLVWVVLARVFTGLRVIPAPWAVLQAIWDDRAIYSGNIATTLSEAAIGFLWGNLLAVALAAVFVQVPAVERLLLRIAVASYCVPLVAIAPILVIVLPGDVPKQALAGLSVFFTTLTAAVLGLRSADRSAIELIRSLGGGSFMVLRKLRLLAALPSLFAGLKIAAPSALLGAIIGEYLGSSSGLGVMLVQAQSSFQVARTWGVALVISALAGIGYAVVAIIARRFTPWAARDVSVGVGAVAPRASGGRLRSLLAGAAGLAGSILLVVAAWYAVIRGFALDPYFAKTPADVAAHLFAGDDAAEHRRRLLAALGTTLLDAGVGYVVGMIAASLVAGALVAFRGAEQVVLPIAIVLRSIPLVALTPLLALIFGRGLLGVTVVVAVVTFFATLVTVSQGLRAAPVLACEVITSLGGGQVMVTRKVRLLYALPSLFASARIAIPGAIAGATLAEWLASGSGLGSLLVADYTASRFAALWSGSVIIVLVSVALYALVAALERPVVARYAPQRVD